jgi:hypothetical protein
MLSSAVPVSRFSSLNDQNLVPGRALQAFAQLFERDARRVGRENCFGLHLRFDPGVDLLLELQILRYSFNDEVRGGNAFALQIRNQSVERVAHVTAFPTYLAEQHGCALDRAGERLGFGVCEANGKAMPCTPFTVSARGPEAKEDSSTHQKG